MSAPESHASSEADFEASGCDDDVWVEFFARSQFDGVGRDFFDDRGFDVGFAGAQRLVEIAIGAETYALLEGEVAR